jgi:ATP-dependent Lon protease
MNAEFPVLPLRDMVVYPHGVHPLFVGTPSSIRALEAAMAGDKHILLLAKRDASVEEPVADDMFEVGTIATVLQLLKLPDGTVKVLVEGEARARVERLDADGAYVRAELVTVPEPSADRREREVLVRSLVSRFEQYVKANRSVPQEVLATLSSIDDPARLLDTIAAQMKLSIADRQAVLEAVALEQRVDVVVALMDAEIEANQVEKTIRGRVKKQMEKSQREYYLNEQMKAIQ